MCPLPIQHNLGCAHIRSKHPWVRPSNPTHWWVRPHPIQHIAANTPSNVRIQSNTIRKPLRPACAHLIQHIPGLPTPIQHPARIQSNTNTKPRAFQPTRTAIQHIPGCAYIQPDTSPNLCAPIRHTPILGCSQIQFEQPRAPTPNPTHCRARAHPIQHMPGGTRTQSNTSLDACASNPRHPGAPTFNPACLRVPAINPTHPPVHLHPSSTTADVPNQSNTSTPTSKHTLIQSNTTSGTPTSNPARPGASRIPHPSGTYPIQHTRDKTHPIQLIPRVHPHPIQHIPGCTCILTHG